MTLKEIKRQIEAAHAAPINADGTSDYFNLLPRVYYKDLPAKLKREADKITIDGAKRFLLECYPVGTLDAMAADQTAFNDKIAEALHAARYLIESTDLTPPKPTGNAAVDAANLETFSPVSLIGADFVEAWESMTPGQVQAIITDKLLSSAYLPMLNGAPANELMQITTKGLKADGFTKTATITTKGGHKITIKHFDKLQGLLSTPAKKILDTALLYLTSSNYYRGDRNTVTPTVEIPLIEYGEACGYRLTPQKMKTPEEQAAENRRVNERIRDLKKNVRRDLRDIANIVWSGEETRGRNKGDYNEMRIISSHSISKGLIRINFDIDAAAYFVNAYIMQYPTALLKHDNRKPNAYVIGRKIAFHNSNDQNHAAGTDSTLSVKSLLAAAPEIPTIDDIEARRQRNWKDKIKKPLEIALDENISVGLISKWEYRNPKSGETYTSETAQPMTWTQYSRLVIDFAMIDAPEQTDRREAKAEAARQAAADKGNPRKKRGRPRKSE